VNIYVKSYQIGFIYYKTTLVSVNVCVEGAELGAMSWGVGGTITRSGSTSKG